MLSILPHNHPWSNILWKMLLTSNRISSSITWSLAWFAYAKQIASYRANRAVSSISTLARCLTTPHSNIWWDAYISKGLRSLSTESLYTEHISEVTSLHFSTNLAGLSPRCAVWVALLHQPLKLVWRDVCVSAWLLRYYLTAAKSSRDSGSALTLGDACMETCPSQLVSHAFLLLWISYVFLNNERRGLRQNTSEARTTPFQ